MFKNLIHRIPKIHHHPHPGPCNFEPREPGERYPKEPELTDYWIKPYLLEALKQYPKLNDDCVVQGLWRFANSIILHNPNISVRKPPTFDDPVVTHKIIFTDKDDIELGAITFWRKVDSTFGIDMKLRGRGLSIVGNNDEATQILADDPISEGSGKQVVNIDYLGDFTKELQDAIDDILERVETLEKMAKDTEPLYKDPNGNIRQVHTAIHNDPDDSAFATCYGIYQYGQAILQAAKEFAQNYIADPIILHQYPHEDDTDKLVSCAGVYKYGQDILKAAQEYCDEHQSGGGSGGGSGGSGGSNDSYIFAYPAGSVGDDGAISLIEIATWDVVTGDKLASAVEVDVGDPYNPDIKTITIDQNSKLSDNFFGTFFMQGKTIYNPTVLNSNDRYRCIQAPEVGRSSYESTSGGNNTMPKIGITAGVFQKII